MLCNQQPGQIMPHLMVKLSRANAQFFHPALLMREMIDRAVWIMCLANKSIRVPRKQWAGPPSPNTTQMAPGAASLQTRNLNRLTIKMSTSLPITCWIDWDRLIARLKIYKSKQMPIKLRIAWRAQSRRPPWPARFATSVYTSKLSHLSPFLISSD